MSLVARGYGTPGGTLLRGYGATIHDVSGSSWPKEDGHRHRYQARMAAQYKLIKERNMTKIMAAIQAWLIAEDDL